MAYIEGGAMKEKRPLWRVSTFVAYFWAVVYFLQSFFSTMFLKEDSSPSRKRPSGRGFGSGRGGGGGGGGGGPGNNPGGGGTGSDPRRLSGMSRIRGIDHTATACGSCCG